MEKINVGDTVLMNDDCTEYTVTGYTSAVDKYQIQCGSDAASVQWVDSELLTLIRKKPEPVLEPGFYPDRSFM